MIKKRKLGKTDLNVSEIGLGGWQLGSPTKINDKPGMAFGGLDENTSLEIINTALEEMPMTTVSEPLINKDCSLRGLVDMEGGSIIKTMSPFVPPHRLIFLKIVSDHFKSSDLKRISVEKMIEAQMKNIHDLIRKVQHPKILDRSILNRVEKEKIQEIIIKYNLTKTQEYELLEWAESHKKIFNNLTKLESYFTVKTNNKKERNKLFESVRESIPS